MPEFVFVKVVRGWHLAMTLQLTDFDWPFHVANIGKLQSLGRKYIVGAACQ